MPKPLKKSDVKRFVREAVRELNSEHTKRGKFESKRDREAWIDGAYRQVDDWWWRPAMGPDRIDIVTNMDESTLTSLPSAVTILQACIEEGWGYADDADLWKGTVPVGAVMAQAFHTLVQAILQQEPRQR